MGGDTLMALSLGQPTTVSRIEPVDSAYLRTILGAVPVMLEWRRGEGNGTGWAGIDIDQF
jgi:hypothetical protein